MAYSMTGFGKSTLQLGPLRFSIEVKTLNGRGLDIHMKNSIIPREREFEVKSMIGEQLKRGTIDLFITTELTEEHNVRTFNREQLNSYKKELIELSEELQLPLKLEGILEELIRLPESTQVTNSRDEVEKVVEEQWEALLQAIREAVDETNNFRAVEGERLKGELLERVEAILSLLEEVKKLEPERVERVRERIKGKIEELSSTPDLNRFEQEMIYYLERLDVTEEMVRLEQHCNYFIETLSGNEEEIGRKLGFITQEIGREINTLGSKANFAQIQKIVVEMKEQLEKIKEQSLNLL